MNPSVVLLIIALALFAVEFARTKSLIAAGLACATGAALASALG